MAALLDVPAELAPLQQQLADVLGQVERTIVEALRADLPPVERLCRHVEKYRGKMIRPTLVALSGLAAGASHAVSPAHITTGAVCELVHLATLVHDDVLDEADTRRGARTVNDLAGNESAVILGDYLFSAAYRLCASLPGQETSRLIGEVGMTLCAGELLQLHHRENFSLDEQTYFEIVDRKTASLIAASCRLGAMHAGGDRSVVAALDEFGRALGIAFQIQDDLLDLTGEAALVGKPLGKDLEKGKLTLPIIHHLATSAPAARGRTLRLLESAGTDRSAALAAALEASGSIDHARRTAESLVARARAAIEPLAQTPARRLLQLMADAVVTRNY